MFLERDQKMGGALVRRRRDEVCIQGIQSVLGVVDALMLRNLGASNWENGLVAFWVVMGSLVKQSEPTAESIITYITGCIEVGLGIACSRM